MKLDIEQMYTNERIYVPIISVLTNSNVKQFKNVSITHEKNITLEKLH